MTNDSCKNCCCSFWIGHFLGFLFMYGGLFLFFMFSLWYFDWIPMVSAMLWSDDALECDGVCALGGLVFGLIISIDIIVCIYAAMYIYWRYTSGLIIATLAVVCLWATFSSSLWPHERLYS